MPKPNITYLTPGTIINTGRKQLEISKYIIKSIVK